jgi:6-phosphogluconolactonase
MDRPGPRKLALLIAGSVAAAVVASHVMGAPAPKGKSPELVFVGTYTGKTASKGIYALRFDERNGKLSLVGVAAETTDPSFLTVDASERFLYAVNETENYQGASSGAISAFSIDHATGKLALLNQAASGGADPCYVALDKTGKYLFVANYTGGNVAVFSVGADGKLGARSAFEQHNGHGPVAGHQESAHAHWIATSPDNRFALSADLGADEVIVDKFDASTGALAPNDPPFARTEPGAGPRHLAFSPNGKFVYVTDELASTVTVFAYDPAAGTLEPKQAIGTLPADFNAPNDTAEIAVHPSGKFLYVSNRGRDSIAVFAIDPKTGILASIGDFLTRGQTPRNFVIDPSGHFLLVANQKTNDLEVFKVDPGSGELAYTGERLEIPSPVDIAFAGNN